WLFMTCLQAVWVYQQAASISPFLAGAWVLLLAGASYLIGAPVYRFLATPRVVEPPKIPPREEMRLSHLRDEVQYLDRYLKNCLRNVEFENKKSEIEKARGQVQRFRNRIASASQQDVPAIIDEICQ